MRMLRILTALVAGLLTTSAYADFTGKDASSATITFKNPVACASVVCVPVFQIYDGTNVVTLATSGGDAASNTLTGVPVYARNVIYNGTTWDRWTGAVTNTGTFAVQAAQSGTWNVTNISGTVSLPTGASTAANQATEIASLATIATNSALPLPAQAVSVLVGGVGISDGTNAALVDPCQSGAKTYTPINIVTAANTKIVTGTAAKKTYICGLFLYPSAADNIAIIEGSGANCATSPLGLIGGATAATGIVATAQAGFVLPTTGYAHAAATVNANDFCLITSAAVQLSGVAVTVAR